MLVWVGGLVGGGWLVLVGKRSALGLVLLAAGLLKELGGLEVRRGEVSWLEWMLANCWCWCCMMLSLRRASMPEPKRELMKGPEPAARAVLLEA